MKKLNQVVFSTWLLPFCKSKAQIVSNKGNDGKPLVSMCVSNIPKGMQKIHKGKVYET